MSDRLKVLRQVKEDLEGIYDRAVRAGVDKAVLQALVNAEDVTNAAMVKTVFPKPSGNIFEDQALAMKGAR